MHQARPPEFWDNKGPPSIPRHSMPSPRYPSDPNKAFLALPLCENGGLEKKVAALESKDFQGVDRGLIWQSLRVPFHKEPCSWMAAMIGRVFKDRITQEAEAPALTRLMERAMGWAEADARMAQAQKWVPFRLMGALEGDFAQRWIKGLSERGEALHGLDCESQGAIGALFLGPRRTGEERLRTLDLLLAAGVSAQGPEGSMPPLWKAARGYQSWEFQQLLERGADARALFEPPGENWKGSRDMAGNIENLLGQGFLSSNEAIKAELRHCLALAEAASLRQGLAPGAAPSARGPSL